MYRVRFELLLNSARFTNAKQEQWLWKNTTTKKYHEREAKRGNKKICAVGNCNNDDAMNVVNVVKTDCAKKTAKRNVVDSRHELIMIQEPPHRHLEHVAGFNDGQQHQQHR